MLKRIQEPNEIFLFLFSAPLDGRTSVEEDDLLGLHAREAEVALAVIEAVETFLESATAAELVVQLCHGTAAVLLREVQLRQFDFAHAMAARMLVEEGYEPDVLGVDHAVRGARMVGCQEAIEMFGTRPGVLPLPFAERHATPFGAARGTTMSLGGVFHDALYLSLPPKHYASAFSLQR